MGSFGVGDRGRFGVECFAVIFGCLLLFKFFLLFRFRGRVVLVIWFFMFLGLLGGNGVVFLGLVGYLCC